MITIFRSAGVLLLVAIVSGSLFAQTTVRTLSNNKLTLSVINLNDTQETDFAAGDLDKDGSIDVVVGRKVPFTVDGPLPNLLLMNDGFANLTDVTSSMTSWVANPNNTRDVELADMNNDGWLDVIFYNSEVEPTEIYLNLCNDQFGVWQGMASNSTNIGGGAGFNTCGGKTLDYDLDGLLDFARADYRSSYEDDLQRQSSSMSFTNMSSLLPSSWLNSEFGASVQTRDPITGAWLDLNMDGNAPDIVMHGSTESKAAYNDGMGGFMSTQQFSTAATYDGVVTDFNGDGRPDIFKINDGTDAIHLNMSTNANGTIVESSGQFIPDSGNFGANPIAADFDGNGTVDVWFVSVDVDIANCNNPRQGKWMLGQPNNPGALFVKDTAMNWPTSCYDAAVADFDGDGMLDLLTSSCGSTSGYSYYLSDPNVLSQSFHSEWNPNANGVLFEVKNIPASPNFTQLYTFFEALFTTDDKSPGPFLGLNPSVLPQAAIGSPPFLVNFQQSPGVQQYYSFQIPILPPAPGLDLIRSVSVFTDPQAPTFAETIVISPVLNVDNP